MILVLCVLALAYRYYSAFLAAKVVVLDDSSVTPAHRLNDGQNYHPTSKWVLFGHHFAAISGAGPLVGPVIAAQHPAVQVTLINSENESVTLCFDSETHLPVKKSFSWRDPVDKQKNLEEEVYENYRAVSGVMAPYNVTRYFNGDMVNQRFLNTVTINQGLDPAMFDPNSRYNPNKAPGKQSGKR